MLHKHSDYKVLGKIRIFCKNIKAGLPSSTTIQDQTITLTVLLHSAPEKLATVSGAGFLADLLRVREDWVRL